MSIENQIRSHLSAVNSEQRLKLLEYYLHSQDEGTVAACKEIVMNEIRAIIMYFFEQSYQVCLSTLRNYTDQDNRLHSEKSVMQIFSEIENRFSSAFSQLTRVDKELGSELFTFIDTVKLLSLYSEYYVSKDSTVLKGKIALLKLLILHVFFAFSSKLDILSLSRNTPLVSYSDIPHNIQSVLKK